MAEDARVDEGRWHGLGPSSELGEGGMVVHAVEGWPVVVARNAGRLVAFSDRCPHQATRLSTGRIRRGTIICPLHGARFNLADGGCIGGAYTDLRLFPCREVNGAIEVSVPDTPPTAADLPAPG